MKHLGVRFSFNGQQVQGWDYFTDPGKILDNSSIGSNNCVYQIKPRKVSVSRESLWRPQLTKVD